MVPFVVFYLLPQFFLKVQQELDILVVKHDVLPIVGVIIIDLGVMLVLWCFAVLFVYKKEPLNPLASPLDFENKGPYKIILHPMLLAVHIILFGEILFLQSPFLLLLLLIWIRFSHLYVVNFKEPYLLAVFGKAYYDYWKVTPRWFPKIKN
ncbi:hypothetical protein D3C87_352660 [compost metagenome]